MGADHDTVRDAVHHIILDLRQMKSFCEKPLIIASGKGVYLTDIDGKRYLDGIAGIFVACLGHGHDAVIDAIRRQQERISFVAPLHAVSDITVRYVAELAKVTPANLSTFKLVSGGSEATETALKFARQYHRQSGNPYKYKFISVFKGYHGATLGALSATGLGGPRKGVFGPFLEGFVHIPPPTCYNCPYGLARPSCDTLCARMLDKFIVGEGAESVAGFIVEPIGNTGGIVTPPPEYFPIIREICTRHNVLLIYDEIITGMGRTGNWFAAQTFGVAPDLLCMGKGMSGGYFPLAAAAIRDDLYYNAFWGADDANIHFAHGHTFGGNPMAGAVGIAVLETIQRDHLILNGQRIGDHIRARLVKEVGQLGILGEVRGKGALVGVQFVEDPATRRSFPAERRFGKRVEARLLEAGLILRCDPDWIALAPPLITTIAEADEMVDILIKCLSDELSASPRSGGS